MILEPMTIGRDRGAVALVVAEFENYVKLNKKISPEVVGAASQIEDYSKLAERWPPHLSIKLTEKAGNARNGLRQGPA